MRRWWDRQNKPLFLALAFSAALHLSAVTMFSIGIWFPAEQRVYHRFDIIDERSGLPLDPSGGGGRLSDAIFGGADLEAPSLRPLPPITLPRVDYQTIGESQLRRAQLDTLARFESMTQAGESGAWSQLETGVERLRSRVSQLNPFSQAESESETAEETLVKLPAPADGFEMYIDWLTGDRKREAFLSGSFPSLENADPGALRAPLSFIVEVDPAGRVTSVMPPLGGDTELTRGLALELERYRFAPTQEGGGRTQHGTVVISRVAEDAP